MALGLTLDAVLMIYLVQFPVLQNYDRLRQPKQFGLLAWRKVHDYKDTARKALT